MVHRYKTFLLIMVFVISTMVVGGCGRKSGRGSSKLIKVVDIAKDRLFNPPLPSPWKSEIDENGRMKEHEHIGEKPGDFRSPCPDYKLVRQGNWDTPEGVIYYAYEAVLKGSFENFYKCFSVYKKPVRVKKYYWKNIRKLIDRYTLSNTDPTYAVCKVVKYDNGEVKIFVASKDPRKSNPPIILKKESGRWKIVVFTP